MFLGRCFSKTWFLITTLCQTDWHKHKQRGLTSFVCRPPPTFVNSRRADGSRDTAPPQGWTTAPCYSPNHPPSWPSCPSAPSNWGRGTEIPHRWCVRQVRGKALEPGFVHVFRCLREQQTDTFCAFAEVGHSGRSRFWNIISHWFIPFLIRK